MKTVNKIPQLMYLPDPLVAVGVYLAADWRAVRVLTTILKFSNKASSNCIVDNEQQKKDEQSDLLEIIWQQLWTEFSDSLITLSGEPLLPDQNAFQRFCKERRHKKLGPQDFCYFALRCSYRQLGTQPLDFASAHMKGLLQQLEKQPHRCGLRLLPASWQGPLAFAVLIGSGLAISFPGCAIAIFIFGGSLITAHVLLTCLTPAALVSTGAAFYGVRRTAPHTKDYQKLVSTLPPDHFYTDLFYQFRELLESNGINELSADNLTFQELDKYLNHIKEDIESTLTEARATTINLEKIDQENERKAARKIIDDSLCRGWETLGTIRKRLYQGDSQLHEIQNANKELLRLVKMIRYYTNPLAISPVSLKICSFNPKWKKQPVETNYKAAWELQLLQEQSTLIACIASAAAFQSQQESAVAAATAVTVATLSIAVLKEQQKLIMAVSVAASTAVAAIAAAEATPSDHVALTQDKAPTSAMQGFTQRLFAYAALYTGGALYAGGVTPPCNL